MRSTSKGHGLQNQVEGEIQSGRSVVAIEELISTGRSSFNAAKPPEDIGCRLIALSNYEVEIDWALEKKLHRPSGCRIIITMEEKPGDIAKMNKPAAELRSIKRNTSFIRCKQRNIQLIDPDTFRQAQRTTIGIRSTFNFFRAIACKNLVSRISS